MTHIAVVVFPGSNCDQDAVNALNGIDGITAQPVWHQQGSLAGYDGVILPGGFSYGDYLRCGAIARFSPIMNAVRDMADAGAPVLGICNGFQILCEAKLLPGALLKNLRLRFLCRNVRLRVEAETPFTTQCRLGDTLTLPIAHGEGRYVCHESELKQINVVFRYCARGDEPETEWNPNGSMHAIAGVANKRGNVLGLMPHPERACDPARGPIDGLRLLSAFLHWPTTTPELAHSR